MYFNHSSSHLAEQIFALTSLFICFQSGGGIHEFADSQFGMCKSRIFFFVICIGPHFLNIALSVTGHVFAYGLSRSAAITNMALALKEIQIRGEIHSNVDYTVDLLNVRNINHLLNPRFHYADLYHYV